MLFTICFIISFLILVIGSAYSLLSSRKRPLQSPVNTFQSISISVFCSGVILFIPIYNEIFSGEKFKAIKVFLISVHNTIRLFIVDGEFDIISEHMSTLSRDFAIIYSVFAAFIFVFAPVLTFSVVFSLFMNIFSHQKLMLNFNKDLYVFSELNEKSLALAQSISNNHPERIIVFNDVFDNDTEKQYELKSEAKKLSAIFLKNDIVEMNYAKKHSKKKRIYLFFIGENDEENIEQCISVIESYKNRANTRMYLFSDSIESEFILNSIDKGKIKLRRINEVQSLVYRNLYSNGHYLFDNAVYNEEIERKVISVAVVGLGKYGIEMTKALIWFCQMEGYWLKLNAYDKRPDAEDKFKRLCPEILDEKHNGNINDSGDAQYQITIHPNIDIDNYEFREAAVSQRDTNYIFVSLGDDEKNIAEAYYIRSIFEAAQLHPRIETVLHSTRKKEFLENAVNFKGDKMDVIFIGGTQSSFSESVIMGSELEKIALERHLKWGDEEEFWSFEYNYRSSVASSIHKQMKIYCNIPGITKNKEDRSEDEKTLIRRLEHRRWNAYMRAEGYTYAKERNDIAKQHNNLVNYDELDEATKIKDDD